MEKQTVIIPTYNRPRLLAQLVNYYRARAPGLKLLVLDSSSPAIASRNASMLSLGQSARHIAYPQTQTVISKLLDGLKRVDTPYALFCADDDVLFPEAVAEAVGFLETNRDYVSAHGIYLNFRPTGSNVHLRSEYAGPSNEASHPCARIFQLLQRYESLFYGTFRTKDLLDIFDSMQGVETLMQGVEAHMYQELFQSVATVIKGKVRRFPSFYAARRAGPPAEAARERWHPHHWFAENHAEMLELFRPYRDALWAFFERHAMDDQMEREAFFKAIDLSHAVYFSAASPAECFYSMLSDQWPRDPFVHVGRSDMLESLRPCSMVRGVARALSKFLGKGWQATVRGYGLARLNAKTRNRVPWQCKVPLELQWLPRTPAFERTWIELCEYMKSEPVEPAHDAPGNLSAAS